MLYKIYTNLPLPLSVGTFYIISLSLDEKEATESQISPFATLKTRIIYLGDRLYPSPTAFPVGNVL